MESAYARDAFVQNGGAETLRSFGTASAFNEARTWMDSLPTFYADELRYYVHAGIYPGDTRADQSEKDRLWIRRPFLEHTAIFEKYIVHGHTPTIRLTPPIDMPDIRSNRVNVDTGAVYGGKLSAAIFDSHHVAPIHTISV